MPLVWKIDPANSLSVAVANGDVTRLEVDRYLDALVESDALIYRKIFDVHEGDTSMTADDVLPLAVVLPPGRGKRLHRALGMVAAAERPMRVFENPLLAYRWISKQDLPGATSGHDEAGDTLEWSAKTRELAAHIRHLAHAASIEAHKMQLISQEEEVLCRGEADLTHSGVPPMRSTDRH